MALTRLIYISTPRDFSFDAVESILETSHVNNMRDHVTGVLLFSQERFMQLLEGEREAVSDCFLRIASDPRHHGVEIVMAREATQRLFPHWTMRSAAFEADRTVRFRKYAPGARFDPRDLPQDALETLCRELADDESPEIAA